MEASAQLGVRAGQITIKGEVFKGLLLVGAVSSEG